MQEITINSLSFTANFGNCRSNERLILQMLKQNKRESKASLARLSGLTAAAVGGLIASLTDKGLVKQVGKVQGDIGQPATLYSLNPEGVFGLGVSINRGHIEVILVDLVGNVVALNKHSIILPSPQKTYELIEADIDNILQDAQAPYHGRIAGIGIASPGGLSRWHYSPTESVTWDEYKVSNRLAAKYGIPAFSQNDGNAGAIAEQAYGLGLNSGEDYAYFFLGSALVESLGGGFILNGQCLSGFTGRAGDVGLLPIASSVFYEKSLSKNTDSLTNLSENSSTNTTLTKRAALYMLTSHLRSKGIEINHHSDLSAAIDAYPDEYQAWLKDCVGAFESAIRQIQVLLDVPLCIIDSEDEHSQIAEDIIDGLNKALHSSLVNEGFVPRVVKGSFGSQASAIGAATLPLESLFR